MEILWVFWHTKIERCCRVDNRIDNHRTNHCWMDNHRAVNLNKTHKTNYPTHHLRFTPLDLQMAHPQPYINEGLQKYPVGRAFHLCKPKSIKSLKTMILNKSPHDNSRKLSWHFLWSTQWHISTLFLWTRNWPKEV